MLKVVRAKLAGTWEGGGIGGKNSDKTYLNLILHLIVHLNVHMVHLVHILVYLVPYFQFSVSPKRSLLYFIGWCSSHISVCSSHIYDGLIENITISSSNLVGVEVEAELGNTSFLTEKTQTKMILF